MQNPTHAIFRQGLQLAEQVAANKLLIVWDGPWPDPELQLVLPQSLNVLWAVPEGREAVLPPELKSRVTTYVIPGQQASRVGRMNVAILVGLGLRLLEQGETLVTLAGRSMVEGLDTILVTDAASEVRIFSSAAAEEGLTAKIAPEVLDALLKRSLDIAADEKASGALFVIGDLHRVRPFTVQAMINPLRGHKPEARSIFNEAIQKKLVEFARLKGAILINQDGYLESAGTILALPETVIEPDGGKVTKGRSARRPAKRLESAFQESDPARIVGGRQEAARGITQLTDAVAMALSARNGQMNVYHRGQLIMQVDTRSIH